MTESRRFALAIALCLAIWLGWTWLMPKLYPPPPRPPATPAAVATDSPAASSPAGTPQLAALPAGAPASQPQASGTRVESGTLAGPIVLGQDSPRDKSNANPYYLALSLTQRGAAIESAAITDHRNAIAARKNPAPDTYDLLAPLVDPLTQKPVDSLVTRRIWLGADRQEIDLSDAVWTAREAPAAERGAAAAFSLTLSRDGKPFLVLDKSYRLEHDSRVVRVELGVQNVSGAAQEFVLTQGGPVGLRREEPRNDDRAGYVLMADRSIKPHPRQELWGKEEHRLEFKPAEEADSTATTVKLFWGGVANKYFAGLMAPVPAGAEPFADFVRKAELHTLFETDHHDLGDLTVDWVVAPPRALAPGGRFAAAFDVYLGPRDPHSMRGVVPTRYEFDRIYHAFGFLCTFEWLTQSITGLFMLLHRALGGGHNYGVAIIILVLIVRAILHPLTRHSQMNMMKMQKAMGALQPKIEELKRKYANDKQKLNAEMLELYRAEGVNPAGNFFSCLPMFLQMPVWVALWTTLNTAIELRHEPFVPLHFWIKDLSAPDALVHLGTTVQLPLLHFMVGPVSSINVLPVLMGLVMYAQQKYSQSLSKPNRTRPVDPNQPDTMAMQQKMMSFMTIFFSLMFYNFPSGLCVYILTSSLMGMAEQIYIRRLIQRKEARGDFAPRLAPDRPPSRVGGFFERLQKKAEEARQIRRETSRR
ncbi:MAG: YidC/Oxa1 family insertase periplasmic-domain containing protein [Phycisphaerae bacterium]